MSRFVAWDSIGLLLLLDPVATLFPISLSLFSSLCYPLPLSSSSTFPPFLGLFLASLSCPGRSTWDPEGEHYCQAATLLRSPPFVL